MEPEVESIGNIGLVNGLCDTTANNVSISSPYVWTYGQSEILPESQVFLKTRRLEFIKLLDAVLDTGALMPQFDFETKYLNALTELELAFAIRELKRQLNR